jgi:hypothetical protein
MSEERKQVLEMLAEGKISAEDAERLLDKLDRSNDASEGSSEETKKRPPKYFCVRVNELRGDSVNIRVPMALVRAGIKLSSLVPDQVREALAEEGVDLSKLSGLAGDELVKALEELSVDVKSEDGDIVRICCE